MALAVRAAAGLNPFGRYQFDLARMRQTVTDRKMPALQTAEITKSLKTATLRC